MVKNMNTKTLLKIADENSIDRSAMVAEIARTVKRGNGLLEEDVFHTVCTLPDAVLDSLVARCDGWVDAWHCVDLCAKKNPSNFADCQALVEWNGYQLESLDELVDDVMVAYIKHNPEETTKDEQRYGKLGQKLFAQPF
jgi:hypothetical protein